MSRAVWPSTRAASGSGSESTGTPSAAAAGVDELGELIAIELGVVDPGDDVAFRHGRATGQGTGEQQRGRGERDSASASVQHGDNLPFGHVVTGADVGINSSRKATRNVAGS